MAQSPSEGHSGWSQLDRQEMGAEATTPGSGPCLLFRVMSECLLLGCPQWTGDPRAGREDGSLGQLFNRCLSDRESMKGAMG